MKKTSSNNTWYLNGIDIYFYNLYIDQAATTFHIDYLVIYPTIEP